MKKGEKECTRCKLTLPRTEFRERTKKGYKYTNPTCRNCDSALAKERYISKKDDEDYKEKNKIRANKYRVDNPEKYKELQKKKRQKEGYKRYVKNYYDKNCEKIREQHRKVCKKAYYELRDWVVVGKLVGKQKELRRGFKESSDLIEMKRYLITLKRLING